MVRAPDRQQQAAYLSMRTKGFPVAWRAMPIHLNFRTIFCVSLGVDWLELILGVLGEAFWEFISFAIAEAFRDDGPSFPKDVL